MKGKNLEFDFELYPKTAEEIWIVSDQRRLWQILLNLISNSLKFTPKGYIKI